MAALACGMIISVAREPLSFDTHGAQLYQGAVVHDLPDLRSALGHFPIGRAGIRLKDVEGLQIFLENDGSIGSIAASLIGRTSMPVRAILFDKSEGANWSLTWHQDRTICVEQRIEVEGFGPWTWKEGMQHVAPPFEVLAGMATLRVHLDDVPAANAPLLIAPGSHREGRVPEVEVQKVVERLGIEACLAKAGDVWAYATPILHASNAATVPGRRRVLQVDFAAKDLPGGLKWLGV